MNGKKIILAGGSGFIGQQMARWFGVENEVVILGRHKKEANNAYGNGKPVAGLRVRHVAWDGKTLGKWASEIDGADLVVNLCGKSVNCRYTAKNKQKIFESRLQPTAILGEAVRRAIVPPKLWINASSATIYRHAEDGPQDEYNGEMPDDFSVQVCKRWEQAFFDERTPFTRKIALRMAIALGVGGVMVPYMNLVRLGLGGHQGHGGQMYSWVHMADICRMVEWAFEHPAMEGAYNCSSPNPVSNKVFMKRVREAMGHQYGLPAYTWMLKLGTVVMGTETELLLKSRWVVPTKMLETGFQFQYPHIEEAVGDVINQFSRGGKTPVTGRGAG